MTIEEINHEIEQLEPAEVNVRNVQVLSSLYMIRDKLGKGITSEVYTMPNIAGTDFNEAVSGVSINDILEVLNEHMNVVQTLYPKEYSAVIQRLRDKK